PQPGEPPHEQRRVVGHDVRRVLGDALRLLQLRRDEEELHAALRDARLVRQHGVLRRLPPGGHARLTASRDAGLTHPAPAGPGAAGYGRPTGSFPDPRRRRRSRMPTRIARTAWNGGLQDGQGQVELTSSKVGTYDVSFPRRAADDAGGVTSPEELIAAAHSSCYAMQFSALLGEAGATPVSLEVTAEVTLAPDPAGGFQIPQIALTVRGEVEGIDEAGFR